MNPLPQPPGAAIGRQIANGAILCAAAAAALICLPAVGVRVAGLAPETRDFLGFGFGGVRGGTVAGLEIALHNSRFAAATIAAALIAPQLGRLVLVLDALLGVLLVVNATVVGVALGAYGVRLIDAVWPHLPLEFAALSLAGGTYIATGRGPLRGCALLVVALLSGGLLLAAGLLEALVSTPSPA